MEKQSRKESNEAFKRVKTGDWLLVGMGLVLSLGAIIYGLILWDLYQTLILIIAGLCCLSMALLHLAWASKPRGRP